MQMPDMCIHPYLKITFQAESIAKLGYKADIANNIINNHSYVGLEKTKYCDDSKVTDHYAIIPTGEGNPGDLRGLSEDVYHLIVRRFLSIFYPAAEYKKVELELKHSDNEYFFVSDKVLKIRGYLEVIDEGEVKPDTKLMTIKQGETITADYNVTEGKTTPPKRYTSGSIILAMENAGTLIEDEELRNQIKSSGIGTSATRAEIIKKLVSNSYIALEKKTQVLKPLIAGEKVYDIVDDNIPALLAPAMTASWEKGLSQIEEGNISKDTYQEKLNSFIVKNIDVIKSKETKQKEPFVPEVINKCPYCGKDLVTTFNGFKCENYGKDEGKCNFYLSEIAKRQISREELTTLLQNGRTDVLEGFKSKEGKKFSAMLVLNKEERKISFEFPEHEVTETDIVCPKCGEHMSKDTWAMKCSCGFQIPHIIAKKQLSTNEVKELIAGRTGLLKGFTSKTGKKFDAILLLTDGKVEFKFPERTQ